MKRVAPRIAGSLVLILALAAPALSEHAPSTAERRFNEILMQDYARCAIAASGPRQLDRFLSANPLSADGQKYGRLLAPAKCMTYPATMWFGTTLFRSAIYVALYRRDYAHSAALPSADQPQLRFAGEVRSDKPEDEASYVSLRGFGDCVVRQEPGSARQLVLSEPERQEENVAFAALRKPMSDCLAPKQTLSFSRQMLRGILAEALYKLSAAAHPPDMVAAS
jgi:hypothetical protein